jgi:hypothetical protein
VRRDGEGDPTALSSQLFHPDAYFGGVGSFKSKLARFKRLTEAYQTLAGEEAN